MHIRLTILGATILELDIDDGNGDEPATTPEPDITATIVSGALSSTERCQPDTENVDAYDLGFRSQR